MLPIPFNLVPFAACHRRIIQPNETLFRQGDKTQGLFFLIEGNIELRRVTRTGQLVIIHRAKTGETFAEASLFGGTYHCDAVATVKSHLVEVDRRIILDKFQKEPDFALAIAKRFAGQNQFYRRKLEILTIKNAEDRIYTAILEGYLQANIKTFSTEIGLTHEAVYRGLANLVTKGLLEKTGRGEYSISSS